MSQIYEELNDDAKEFFLLLLDEVVKDKEVFKRCKKEINILHEKGYLFIIEYLYKYKKKRKKVKLHFRGMANNLLLLYVLGISYVDPIKYGLPYELYTDKSLTIDFINGTYLDFVSYIDNDVNDIKIFEGTYEKEEINEIDKFEDNHFLIIPDYYQPKDLTFRINDLHIFETIEDYRMFKDKYLIIRLDDREPIFDKNVDIKNVINSKFDEDLVNKLKPSTMEEYAKVISLGHGAHVWSCNQEYYYDKGLINIDNVIATREDVYEYLLDHSVDIDDILDIIKYLRVARNNDSNKLWMKYVGIMKKHKCSEMFIDILSNMYYIFGRGQVISECLYVLDKSNYYSKVK